jgi:uncharacterized protein DUF1905/bacteriocin resistance YdeI/OmpD-like protein
VGALEPLGIFGEPSFHVSGDLPAGSLSADAANPIVNLVDCEIATVGVQKLMTTMSQRAGVPTIRFDATLHTIDKSTLLRLPEKASVKLPSRGQVAVQGTINGHRFQTVLEPDGNLGHWMRIDRRLQESAALSAGDSATLEIESVKDWPEPSVPQDLKTALAAAPQKIQDLWKEITPMARWEWVRWVNATQNAETRKRRVEVSISKMKSGKRRPCCFNLAACTDPNLSKNGRLVEPA